VIFQNPVQLFWLLALAMLIVHDRFHQKKRDGLMSHLFGAELAPLMLSRFDPKARTMKRLLFYLALFFLILALAQPQWGKRQETVSASGIDVVIAVDVSKSMNAADLKPTRLMNAKVALDLISGGLAGDRLALVAFAGSSFIECPLTPDVGAVQMFLGDLTTDLIPVGGTDIGSAIRTSILAFGESKASKAIILITDGEDLSGGARGAADEAASRGIRIYPVGIGTAAGNPVPAQDDSGNQTGYKKDKSGQIVVSRLDEQLLNDIAQKTGGSAFFAGDKGSTLPQLMAAVAALPRSPLSRSSGYEYADRFQWFLFISFICLAFELLISERKK